MERFCFTVHKISLVTLSIRAHANCCYGLLGIPHLLQDDWYRFKEKLLSSAPVLPSKTTDSRAVAINECSINCSTSTILSLLDVDSLPQQPVVVPEEVMISAERHQSRAIIAAEPIDKSVRNNIIAVSGCFAAN